MIEHPTLRERLKDAIDEAPQRLTQAMIAAECQVTTQAVGGWLRTGRVDKRHFPTLARLTGKPLAYFHGQDPSTPADNDGKVVESQASYAMRPDADTLRTAMEITDRVLANVRVAVTPTARAEITLALYDLLREGQGINAAERTVSHMLRAVGGLTATTR